MKTITGMYGLGDNIYQRAVVREMGPVALVTAWPQLYQDLPDVKCLPARTTLRTQAKNVREYDWHGMVPQGLRGQRIGYDGKGTILQSLLTSAGLGHLQELTFDLPFYGAFLGMRKYVVVRPATVRKEWPAASRNPDTIYIAHATQQARLAGYRVIVVADLQDGEEWLVDDLPPHDLAYLRGELPIDKLLGLVAGASGVIGGVGWLLPAAMAYRVPMLLLYGGWGMMNGPQRVLDPRIDSSTVVQVMPTNFCMCNDRDHLCDKTISLTNLRRNIDVFLGKIDRSNAHLVG